MDWTLPLRFAADRFTRQRDATPATRRRLIELPDGSSHAVAGALGTTLRCVGGTLWVTQAGMPDDVILMNGQTYTSMHRGKVVAMALGHAVVEIGRRPAR